MLAFIVSFGQPALKSLRKLCEEGRKTDYKQRNKQIK